jgi:hypothetical protein
VDWHDIPLGTEEWGEEACSGVESADSFAFVISPDSLDSPFCRAELDHAVDNNKRLAPIWHRDVAEEYIPPVLAAHQYIEFHEDDFEEVFRTLLVRTPYRRSSLLAGVAKAAPAPSRGPLR